jgi:calreticulin
LIDNPEYKGEWKAPKIPNPAYKGEWVHPFISNPDYSEDSEIYAFASHKYLGIEIWQVKAGTIFDNFLVTDSVETAAEWAEKTLKSREGEKAAEDKDLEEKRKNAPAEEEAGEELELDDEDLAAEELHDEL